MHLFTLEKIILICFINTNLLLNNVGLPYRDEQESCAVSGTGPGGGWRGARGVILDPARFGVVVGPLLILREGAVLLGVVRISLQ